MTIRSLEFIQHNIFNKYDIYIHVEEKTMENER